MRRGAFPTLFILDPDEAVVEDHSAIFKALLVHDALVLLLLGLLLPLFGCTLAVLSVVGLGVLRGARGLNNY